MAVTQINRWNAIPGTNGAGTPEGVVVDGQESVEVHVTLTGAPAQIAADYATLVTNVSALTTGKIMTWNKR